MKILITGSSGYLGNSFINKYEKDYSFNKFSLLTDNISALNLSNIETILHCAALVHQQTKHPYEKYYEINVSYPLTLAKKAKKAGVRQFIFISTIAVYGEDYEKIFEDSVCNPITPYGKSKLEAEKQLLELNDNDFIVSIVRPPMIYGQNAPGNIDSLVKLVQKVPVIPLGLIKNRRSFIFIGNLVHLINELIFQKKSGIFLASDDEAISTSKLIELISMNLNKNNYLIKILFFEKILELVKPNFHKRLYGNLEVDNSITRQKLNLKNPFSITEGIRLMIKGERQ